MKMYKTPPLFNRKRTKITLSIMKIFFPFLFQLLILNEPPCAFPSFVPPRSATLSSPFPPGRFQFFSRNRPHAWPGGAPFNEIKNK